MSHVHLTRWLLAILVMTTASMGWAQDQGQPELPILSLDAGGHTARVQSLLFVPGDRELVSIADDKTIRVWDVLSGEPVRTIRLPVGPGNEGQRYSMAIMKDGKTLLVGGYGLQAENYGMIYAVSLDSGRLIRKFPGHTDVVNSLGCSPDGLRFASGSADNTIRIWNFQTGQTERILEGHHGAVYGVAFSPDGQKLASGSYDQWGAIWDLQTGQILHTLQHGAEIRALDWSRDGRTIVTGSHDGNVRLWNPNGTLRHTIGNLTEEAKVSSVRFSRDSQKVVFAVASPPGPWPAGVIDVASATVVSTHNHDNTGMAADISGNGKLVASGDFLGEIHLWNAADGSEIRRIASKGKTVWSVGWNKDATMIAWGHTYGGDTHKAESQLERIFDLSRLEITESTEEVFTKATLVNGTLNLVSGGYSSVDVNFNNEKIATLEMTSDYDKKYNQVRSFTLMSKQRAVIGADWGLYLHDIKSGERLRSFIGHTGTLWCVSPSPDGRFILSGCSDQTISMWDPDRDSPLLTFFFAGDEWIVWAPEGYYAASPGGERLMGWHVNNGLDNAANFFPASQFHKTFYRPDIIKLIARTGSVDEAVRLAGETKQVIDDVLPPTVLITSPDRATLTVEDAEISIRAAARQVGAHPIKSMQLMLDGRPYGGRTGKVEFQKPEEEIRHEFRVTLNAGRKHTIAVRADSEVSHGMSSVINVTYNPVSKEKQLPTLYVLAMGVAEYKDDDLKLNYAANDAKKVAESFSAYSTKVFKKVETKVVVDGDATRSGMLQGLQWLKRQMTQNDIGVVFFSGHGEKDETGTFYLLPSDTDKEDLVVSAVSDPQVKGILQGIPAPLVILLDACHSGAAGGDKRKNTKAVTDDFVRTMSNDDFGMWVMASSTGREFSMESSTHKNGYFTVALTEGLAGVGSADANGDGTVFLNELDTYVTDRVKELTGGKQHPATAKPATIQPFPLSKKN